MSFKFSKIEPIFEKGDQESMSNHRPKLQTIYKILKNTVFEQMYRNIQNNNLILSK